MITVRTSPAYVNRVRQDWTANGGVYGDGGVYAVVPSNDPFAQLGPTLDLTFAGVPTNQFTAATTDGYSINLNLSSEIYQIAVEYAVWSGYQVNYALLPAALTEAALNTEPAKTLFKDTLIGGRPLGDINNDGSVTAADATAYQRFNGSFWLNTADRNDYIRTVLNPYMLANPGLYAAYLTPSTGLAQQTFAEIITFTRTGTGGTFFNSAGVLTTAAADQPRFDYDPSTLAAQGLLIEEQRTNSIRNNTMQGAVAGTPGTLPTNWSGSAPAVNVIGTGIENGITYVDLQVVGTTGATTGNLAFDTITATAAASGQTWTTSVYIRLVAGSFTNVSQVRVNMQGYTSASASNADAFSSTDIISSLSATNISTNRRTITGTLADATTAYIRPRLFINWTNGAAVDFTLRIGLPQLELGAFATSVIPTTTTALTRSADVASVNTLSPWFNATEGTLFVDASPQVSNTASCNLAELNDATASNRIGLFKLATTGNASLAVLVSGATQASTNSGAWTATGKLAGAYKLDDFASSLNGSAAATDTLGTIPTVTQLTLGRRGDGVNLLNGHLRRVTYYPRRLSNADLQTITI